MIRIFDKFVDFILHIQQITALNLIPLLIQELIHNI